MSFIDEKGNSELQEKQNLQNPNLSNQPNNRNYSQIISIEQP